MKNYFSALPDPNPKFPVSLCPPDELETRLTMAYGEFVSRRNNRVIWDNFTKMKIADVVSWMKEPRQHGLLLYGSLGNGKTTMLKSLNLLFGRFSVLVSAKDIYDDYRVEGHVPSYQGKILIIDDLGTEPEKCLIFGEEHHPLSTVLLKRYEYNSTTIIATNLDINDIKMRYGDRVFDRLLEMFSMSLYTAPSYRLTNGGSDGK